MKANWTFVLAWLLAVAAVAEADAQTGQYPTKPVQIITDSSAGSTPDVALRIVADGLTQSWKQQVLVNNHPGAGGSLAVRLAAAAAPDGYTLYQPVLSPELQRKLAPLGSYTNPMSAAETTAFVHKQQQTWQPILDEIAKNQR